MWTLTIWFGLGLLWVYYCDQCLRASAMIRKAYPEFDPTPQLGRLDRFANGSNPIQGVSTVHEFLDSRAPHDVLPAQCQLIFRRLRYLRWIMLIYFAAMVIYAFLF
ncbi:hypothetical protein SAMN02745857_03159 [Andreprevotia lacus DSM 23236]|uniref:Uncharacterized protein n=2 Tax=Andreprevotia TaxID=397275 RepID=A0A1W1XW69_9NEIS|nr:hypothetical protein SAMN02745857_03159 [Andreprevotia lacus DSM 23236]